MKNRLSAIEFKGTKKTILILSFLLCIGNVSCIDELVGPSIVGTWEMEVPYSITLFGFITMTENHFLTFQSNGKGVHRVQQITTAMGEKEVEEGSERFNYIFNKDRMMLSVTINEETTTYRVEQLTNQSLTLYGGDFSHITFFKH